jgi:hypothetical protein
VEIGDDEDVVTEWRRRCFPSLGHLYSRSGLGFVGGNAAQANLVL